MNDKPISEMTIPELWDESEYLEEQFAELTMEGMQDQAEKVNYRLKQIEDRLRKEGEI